MPHEDGLGTAIEIEQDDESIALIYPTTNDDMVHRARMMLAGNDLIEAAKAALAYDEAIQACANDHTKMATYCTAQGDDLDALYLNWISASSRAMDTLNSAPIGDPD